ncbi:ParB/RepB/Spo0J family partition protein [Streptomyces sp. 8N114]|uniref:ParB/RepB/Spo0J family partition protein n=1 Tax=Streptomyces sp. 8N114 TaxID=3457419 RepID=UPI003FCF389B
MSRVADQLGTGASFGRAASRGRSARGRAKAVAQGDIPAYELVHLPLDRIAPTPLNPRRNFGTDEDLARFGEELRHAQLAACVAVTIGAYLKLWPEQEQRLGDVDYVLVNGERRFRSALHVGLEVLDFVVRDDLAATKEDFIDHLLKENLEREDFDVIERARGVQQMVEVCEEGEGGARARAAQRLGRDRSWVTNQLALLRLPVEIQAMLSSGEMPERDGRQLARHVKDHPGLDAAALIEHWKGLKELAAQKRDEEKALLEAARGQKSDVLSADNTASPSALSGKGQKEALSADNTGAAGKSDTSGSGAKEKGSKTLGALSADNTGTPDASAPGAGGDRQDSTADAKEDDPYVLPWGDPEALCKVLMRRMTRTNRVELTKLLINANTLEAGDRP